MYTNFKCWDKKGNRYALFGEPMKDGRVTITQVKCSKKDQFSREIAKKALFLDNCSYETATKLLATEPEFHPMKFIISPKEEGDTCKWTFTQYCKDNFLNKKPMKKEEINTLQRYGWYDAIALLKLAYAEGERTEELDKKIYEFLRSKGIETNDIIKYW